MVTAAKEDVQRFDYPKDDGANVDFVKPIRIHWAGGAEGYRLHVGTGEGNWDLLNYSVGKKNKQVIELDNLPKDVKTAYVQVVSTNMAKELHEGKLVEVEVTVAERVVTINR